MVVNRGCSSSGTKSTTLITHTCKSPLIQFLYFWAGAEFTFSHAYFSTFVAGKAPMANRSIKTLFVGIAASDWLAKHRHSHTDRIFHVTTSLLHVQRLGLVYWFPLIVAQIFHFSLPKCSVLARRIWCPQTCFEIRQGWFAVSDQPQWLSSHFQKSYI